ncbi:hypothetical protein EGW08_020553 [Elysia chlorotica]|uniref:glycerophosphocholine cholinephosphodiesterase n=1 Tax=Elysia chlorotica TaxID=188477 RepID=A0A3S0Z6D9_ELYCH|nr:hypothetical protein EGW08_020553 [Elysia chlorotica]
MALQDIDTEVGKLLDRMEALDDDEKFNLVIFSDHGMTTIDPARTINITDALNSEPGLYTTIMEGTALVSIYTPNKQAEDKVFTLLKDMSPHMHVYRQEDIPARFYYKDGPFVSSITCIADLGWTILQPLKVDFPTKGATKMVGYHGYDNGEVDMRGIFYAYGPYFKPGSRVDHIQAIDPYSVMCNILELTPSANNGSLAVFEPLKAVSGGNTVFASILSVWFSGVVGLLAWRAG